jgi:hypothetical protein
MASTEPVDPMASVRSYLAAEKSSNTRRAYTAVLLTLRPGVEEFSRIRCRLVHLSSPATWPSSPTVG